MKQLPSACAQSEELVFLPSLGFRAVDTLAERPTSRFRTAPQRWTAHVSLVFYARSASANARTTAVAVHLEVRMPAGHGAIVWYGRRWARWLMLIAGVVNYFGKQFFATTGHLSDRLLG